MKAYPTIITIIAILAIGAAGYFYWQNSEANKKITNLEQDKVVLQKDLNKTNTELELSKKSFDGIEPFSTALKAVLDSFIAGGDTKVGNIDPTKTTLARQKIGDITDNIDKTSAEKSWNDFSSSTKLRDLQPLLITLSDGIDRNIKNITNPPK